MREPGLLWLLARLAEAAASCSCRLVGLRAARLVRTHVRWTAACLQSYGRSACAHRQPSLSLGPPIALD